MAAATLATTLLTLLALAYFVPTPATSLMEDSLNEYQAPVVDMQVRVTDDGAIRFTQASGKEIGPVVEVYSDFQCVNCAALRAVDSPPLGKAVQEGQLVAELHPLSSIGRETRNPSTLAIAALWTVAESGNAPAVWALWDFLYEYQPFLSNWTVDNYADALARFEVSPQQVERFQEEHYAIGWDIATLNAEALGPEQSRLEHLPQVHVNGVRLGVTNTDGQFINWVPNAITP